MSGLLFEDDRFFLLGSAIILSQFVTQPLNDKFTSNISDSTLIRLTELLLLKDEVLINHVLDFLGKYTMIAPHLCVHLLDVSPTLLSIVCHYLMASFSSNSIEIK